MVGRPTRLFADRILPFGADEALIWGRLSRDIGHGGADQMITATAVTGNAAELRPTGVPVEDPF